MLIETPVNGILQPLTGRLSLLVSPTPQPHGLKAIPGDDPAHQYVAPGSTDQRGVCPALNTLANHGYLSRDGMFESYESSPLLLNIRASGIAAPSASNDA